MAIFDENLHPRLHGKFAKKYVEHLHVADAHLQKAAELRSVVEQDRHSKVGRDTNNLVYNHMRKAAEHLDKAHRGAPKGSEVRSHIYSARSSAKWGPEAVHEAVDHAKSAKAAVPADHASSAVPPEKDWIDVGEDVNKAADLLAQGKYVRLSQPRVASTLLAELASRVNAAKEAGTGAPNFDLCRVTVPNTNLFCAESKGIPRVKMPQLSGIPTPGSKADALPKDEKGGVKLTEQFRQMLTDRGIHIDDASEKASFLKASQIELNGGKVGAMTKVLDGGGKLGGDPRLFVSSDNYIVDGHHRWAAHVGHDLHDNNLGDVEMPVARVNMDIVTLLFEANQFAADWGIPQADVSENSANLSIDTCTPVDYDAYQRHLDSARLDLAIRG